MAAHGRLVVLEGIDDAALGELGKSLCRWLRGLGVAAEHTQEPTYGPAGSQVILVQQGRLQLDAMSLALLCFADRLDHMEREDGILSWLEAGRHVVCVHFGLYAYARQWGEVEWDWQRRIDALCREPDLTLYVSPCGQNARDPGGQHARCLCDGYSAAIARLRGEGQPVVVVDGRSSSDEIRGACQRHVADLLDLSLECVTAAPL